MHLMTRGDRPCGRPDGHNGPHLSEDAVQRQRAISRAWAAANREKARANSRGWAAANTEKMRAYQQAWYQANREKARANSRAWAAANPEKMREYMHRYDGTAKGMLKAVRNNAKRRGNQ